MIRNKYTLILLYKALNRSNMCVNMIMMVNALINRKNVLLLNLQLKS